MAHASHAPLIFMAILLRDPVYNALQHVLLAKILQTTVLRARLLYSLLLIINVKQRVRLVLIKMQQVHSCVVYVIQLLRFVLSVTLDLSTVLNVRPANIFKEMFVS
jgi:hypothetical protein